MDAIVELQIERAVAGGRMLGRVDGQVVLVAGAIPGERVRAQIERSTSHVAWGTVVEILERSPDRRPVVADPSCGGLTYAHIEYDRQRVLKGEVIADAFRRVGKITLDTPIAVRPSAEQGYRLRARIHVRGGRFGFYRERTHEICDAATSGQLRADSIEAVGALLGRLDEHGNRPSAIIIGENVSGNERVLHLESEKEADYESALVDDAPPPGVSGITAWREGGVVSLSGHARLQDTAGALFGGETPPVPAGTVWQRTAASFFQGNRFLIGSLVSHVLSCVEGDTVADLYAGVGLFSVALAASGRRVLAIEGDRTSAADLAVNAGPFVNLEPHHGSVERAVRRLRPRAFTTVILDPPRTGLTKDAIEGVLTLHVPRLVYVSCDPATLARDSALIVARGYGLSSLEGFDLFPATGHVEAVAVFDRRPGA